MYTIRRIHSPVSTDIIYHILFDAAPVALICQEARAPLTDTDNYRTQYRFYRLSDYATINKVLPTVQMTAKQIVDFLNDSEVNIDAIKVKDQRVYVRYTTAFGFTLYLRSSTDNMGYDDFTDNKQFATAYKIDAVEKNTLERINYSINHMKVKGDVIVHFEVIDAETHEIVKSSNVPLHHPIYQDQVDEKMISESAEMKAIFDSTIAAKKAGQEKMNPYRAELPHFRAYELGWAEQ
jgi:hypothetical protein